MENILNNQKKIWDDLWFPKQGKHFVLNLYKKYQNDLRKVKAFQSEFYAMKDKIGLVPQLGDIEAEITYLLIREYKPSVVVEISPASGWSTSWILNALKDNGSGKLYSYDFVDSSTKTIPDYLSEDRWEFIKGDIRINKHLLPPKIDYLFIDSDHSADFALWYLNHIFPLYDNGLGLHVSVHDVLKLANEPGWGEESNILCSWLFERQIPCITASRALEDKSYSACIQLRTELDLDSVIHPPNYNSMIFFSL